jgi:putative two-component system response regulator
MGYGSSEEFDSHPFVVLGVDDEPNALMVLEGLTLSEGHVFHGTTKPSEAVALVLQHMPDVVLLDVMMPGISGYDVCRAIKANEVTRMIPVVLLTALDSREDRLRGIEAGCDDFLSKPFDRIELRARVRSLARTKRMNENLDHAEMVLATLARAVEAKDGTTGDHCDRLTRNGIAFGRFLGLNRPDLQALARAGVLHDIGKVGIPDAVLLKPARLTSEEWVVMRRHPVIGAELLAPLRTMDRVVPVVRHHHERWDGGGYPDGLAGDRIPLLARVFQVLDAFDALTSARPYKAAFCPEEAMKLLLEETTQGKWDPAIVEAFERFRASTNEPR